MGGRALEAERFHSQQQLLRFGGPARLAEHAHRRDGDPGIEVDSGAVEFLEQVGGDGPFVVRQLMQEQPDGVGKFGLRESAVGVLFDEPDADRRKIDGLRRFFATLFHLACGNASRGAAFRFPPRIRRVAELGQFPGGRRERFFAHGRKPVIARAFGGRSFVFFVAALGSSGRSFALWENGGRRLGRAGLQ
ncbi:MAG: hypothetical protein ABW032_09150 [Burkholderiaceae bacterium]